VDASTNVKWKVQIGRRANANIWATRFCADLAGEGIVGAAGNRAASIHSASLDHNSGQLLWQKSPRSPSRLRAGDSFAAASAMTDGEHVYALWLRVSLPRPRRQLRTGKSICDQQTRNDFAKGDAAARQ
jgi:hypothetical protein